MVCGGYGEMMVCGGYGGVMVCGGMWWGGGV